MTTIQEVFGNIAVLFKDSQGHSHAIPNCEHVTGTTEVITDYEQRGNFVCGCIPIEIAPPVDPRLSPVREPQSAPVSRSGQGSPTTAIWPTDLPQSKLGTLEQVEAWLADLPRKLDPSDVSAIPALSRWATTYVMDEDNQSLDNGRPNDFITSVADACARYNITAGQAKGVLNWWRAQVKRNKPASNKTEYVETNGIDLSSLEAGMYAVPGGDTRLKVCINKPERGNWKGFIFVHDGAEYGQQQKYGMQKPDKLYTGEIIPELKIIMSDPVAAIAAYGHLTGRCGVCNRKLEDEESVARGIGPVCYAKLC